MSNVTLYIYYVLRKINDTSSILNTHFSKSYGTDKEINKIVWESFEFYTLVLYSTRGKCFACASEGKSRNDQMQYPLARLQKLRFAFRDAHNCLIIWKLLGNRDDGRFNATRSRLDWREFLSDICSAAGLESSLQLFSARDRLSGWIRVHKNRPLFMLTNAKRFAYAEALSYGFPAIEI